MKGNFTDKQLLLASKSPRRSELLRLADFNFTIIDNLVDEFVPPGMDVTDIAQYLADKKGEGNRKFLTNENQIIISSDSVVILEGEVFGKPVNEANAIEMLSRLSGKTHTVITGVCLLSLDKKVLFDERAEVEFWPIEEEEINYYIREYRPLDKAGAYGIQEWLGLCMIKSIRGNYSTIMGLPVARLYHELKAF